MKANGDWVTHSGLLCLECRFVIFSYNRHDYKHCHCGNSMVDGGFDYFRRSANDKQMQVQMRVYKYKPVVETETERLERFYNAFQPKKSDNQEITSSLAVVPSTKQSKKGTSTKGKRSVPMRQLSKAGAKARSAR